MNDISKKEATILEANDEIIDFGENGFIVVHKTSESQIKMNSFIKNLIQELYPEPEVHPQLK